MSARIAVSPLTGRIFSGRINKAGNAFVGFKTDVTSDVLRAVIEKAEFHGGTFAITSSDGGEYTVTVSKATDNKVVAPTDELPMQPVVIVDGIARFKENRIVSALLEHAQKQGYGLNEIARGDFSQDERMQIAQLIGYSVSGYGDLSYATDDSCNRADAIVRRRLAE